MMSESVRDSGFSHIYIYIDYKTFFGVFIQIKNKNSFIQENEFIQFVLTVRASGAATGCP